MITMADKFLYRGTLGLRSVGIPKNFFVRIAQGNMRDDGCVLTWDDTRRKSVDESFEVFEREPEALIGSAVYRVRGDSTLQLVRENWDTSG